MKGATFTLGRLLLQYEQFQRLEFIQKGSQKAKITSVIFIADGRLINNKFHISKTYISHKFICAN
jgi:hypothetical protein